MFGLFDRCILGDPQQKYSNESYLKTMLLLRKLASHEECSETLEVIFV